MTESAPSSPSSPWWPREVKRDCAGWFVQVYGPGLGITLTSQRVAELIANAPEIQQALEDLIAAVRSRRSFSPFGLVVDGSPLAEATKAAERLLGRTPPEDVP